jgi:DNA-binding Lrp family transcriptional regulator
MTTDLDHPDIELLRLLVEEPRVGGREYARVLGVARGTVQSRIGRLEPAHVIQAYAASVYPGALGFSVQAFVHMQLAQGKLDEVTTRLTSIPEVLEAHSTTGEWGERIAAAPGRTPDPAELKEWVRVRLRSSKAPPTVEVVEALPYNDNGKLVRRMLREHLAARPES